MADLYPRINIVPIDSCLAHEGVVDKWVDQIAANILDQGTIKNPIIVAPIPESHRNGHKWVVIDGMHRFAALKKLEVRDVLVCEIDYFSDKIQVAGWDAFTFKPIGVATLFRELFPESAGYHIAPGSDHATLQKQIVDRSILLAACDKGGNYIVLKKPGLKGEALVEELITVTQKIDMAIDARQLKPLYVANAISLQDFQASDAQSIVIRPHFTKDEIIERTLANKLFPRKSTRHIIPDRPLRIDINLSLLRANIDLEAKNRLLDEHLKWCYQSDRVRYYPESVFIFSD